MIISFALIAVDKQVGEERKIMEQRRCEMSSIARHYPVAMAAMVRGQCGVVIKEEGTTKVVHDAAVVLASSAKNIVSSCCHGNPITNASPLTTIIAAKKTFYGKNLKEIFFGGR